MKRHRSVFVLVIVASMLFSLISVAAAQAEGSKLHQVLERGHLIVGTGSTNPPWHFINDDGELAGFDVDIARMIAEALFDDPTRIEFVDQSPDSRIPNLTTDKVDIACQFMTVTAGRAQQVAFTTPYYREGVGLLLRAGSEYADYDALLEAGSDVTVSVLQNVYAEDMVHQALPEAEVNQYDSVDRMYQALNSRRADAAATDVSSLRWFMQQNPDQFVDSGHAWNPQSYSCAVRQGQTVWLQFVNTVINEALTGVGFPAYAEAYEQWFGETPEPPSIGFPAEYR